MLNEERYDNATSRGHVYVGYKRFTEVPEEVENYERSSQSVTAKAGAERLMSEVSGDHRLGEHYQIESKKKLEL